ncbi:MAG: porin family protein [Bacteroidota bacterium]
MRISKLFSLIGLSVVILPVPLAACADQPGVYLGASWGGYRINESDFHDNDNLVKGFVGGQFTDWFGIEGQWTDFNRLDNGNSRFDADGKGLAAVFSLPLASASSFFVKGGQFWWDSNSALGGVVGDKDGNDPFWGAGFKLGFNKNLAMRLEYERYDVSKIKLDTATVGLQLNF